MRMRAVRGASKLLISELLDGYRSRRLSPPAIIDEVLSAIEGQEDRRVWITLLPPEHLRALARALAAQPPDSLPLYGIPFAIKDNIDLAGVPTSAGCREFTYTPTKSAPVVERLLAAGAIPIGKTNLDQFATGLAGTRSPWGACRNSIHRDFISGGSSSGSAVAVATGQVSFALGSDTAGSGRVPAAFNNLIGFKPTCGRLSTRGVVPACRSLDCVAVLTRTAADAARVLAVVQEFDEQDPYSRRAPPSPLRTDLREGSFCFGVPQRAQLKFFGEPEYPRLFDTAVAQLESLGGERREIDFEPFLAAGRLLYEGPFLAERYCAVGDFIERHPEAVLPVTRRIISAGRAIPAPEVFAGQHRLRELARAVEQQFTRIDVLATPTAGTIYRIAAVEADPVTLSANLSYYTNFTNLLDLTAVAVPAGVRGDGLPFGICLSAPAWSDAALLALAARFETCAPRRTVAGAPPRA
jgi:allophanate hydrolase